MKHLRTAIFTMGSLASLSVAAQSDMSTFQMPTEGTQEITLSGAGSSDKEFDSKLFGLEGSYGQYISPRSLVGVRQTASVSDSSDGDSSWNGATRAFYDYHFTETRTRPFVGANLGYVYGESTEESFLAGLELGVKHYVLASTFMQLQIEYQYLFEDSNDIENRFDDGSFVYSVGMGFNF